MDISTNLSTLVTPSSDFGFKSSSSVAISHLGQITPPSTPNEAKRKEMLQEQPDWSAIDQDHIMTWKGSFELGEVIGGGYWSKVYAARDSSDSGCTNPNSTPPPSPHMSQANGAGQTRSSLRSDSMPANAKNTSLLAIKSPSQKMALPILKNEANILSFLTRFHDSSSYIIEFFGEDPDTNALVFTRAEHTLMDITSSALKNIPASLPQTDPITTLPFWLHSARHLISALSWIHSHNIVHGDIKPANILSTFSGKLVFADFSSSFHLSPSGSYEVRATDAITTEYASPELLKSWSISRPITDTSPRHPTFASDVWALACTLLVAATGAEPYSSAGNTMRRLAMAKDGSVVASYLNADDWRVGLRVKNGGIVERVVRPALVKLVEKRVDCEQWLGVVDEIAGAAEL